MSKVLCERKDLVAIADSVREKTGNTEQMTLGEVKTSIDNFSVAEDGYHDVSEVTATAETVLMGSKFVDADGEVIEGAIMLEEKTVTPTDTKQIITPSVGCVLSKVTVNAMPAATQATPSITVSSAGLITAKATQSAGYVASGTKSATKQLTTQAAKTVTPTTSNQTAVASGRYTTGAITVKGDSNLVAGNIKSGVSIFGVTGTYEGGGGSGGGGASGGTCTFTVQVARSGKGATTIPPNSSINYLNEQGEPVVYTLSTISTIDPQNGSVTVRKNSLVVITIPNTAINNISGTAISHTGDCVVCEAGVMGMALFSDSVPVLVNGDSSVSILI